MKSIRDYRDIVVKLLCGKGAPLSFRELEEEVARLTGGKVNKFLLRQAIAELVREGVISRNPDYERRVMVFEASRCSS